MIDDDEDCIRDEIGNMPFPESAEQALKEIVYIATDKRAHVLLKDHCNWLELKLKAIAIMANRGLDINVL